MSTFTVIPDHVFTELNKPLEDEIIALKNDVLKLVENVDRLEQLILNLNYKVKRDHEKFRFQINEIFICLEQE